MVQRAKAEAREPHNLNQSPRTHVRTRVPIIPTTLGWGGDRKLVGQLACGIQKGRNKTASQGEGKTQLQEVTLWLPHMPHSMDTYQTWRADLLLTKGQESHRYCVISGEVTTYQHLRYPSLALDFLSVESCKHRIQWSFILTVTLEIPNYWRRD